MGQFFAELIGLIIMEILDFFFTKTVSEKYKKLVNKNIWYELIFLTIFSVFFIVSIILLIVLANKFG